MRVQPGRSSGKTTLFHAIATGHPATHRAPGATLGYFDQRHDQLDRDQTVLENVMNTSILDQSMARTILARLMIPRDEVYKRCAVLSGGELCKVMLCKLLCMQPSILLLDEPTNYLDVYALEALEEMVVDFPGTVLFISHDRTFIDHVAGRILTLTEGRLVDENEIKIRSKRNDTQKMLLELRRDTLISQLSFPPPGVAQETLEEELQQIIAQLKELNDED